MREGYGSPAVTPTPETAPKTAGPVSGVPAPASSFDAWRIANLERRVAELERTLDEKNKPAE
jgi:hypothetical protein